MNYKDNNRGSTLLVVLVCVSLIGVLAVAMLALSTINIQMKGVARQSASSQYDAETALNEIIAGLTIDSEESLKEAYTYGELYYSSTPADERSKLVNRKYASVMANKLCSYYTINDGVSVKPAFEPQSAGSSIMRIKIDSGSENAVQLQDKLASYADKNYVSVLFGPASYISYDKDESVVKLQGMTVKTAYEGYETDITTDLVFTPPFDAIGSSGSVSDSMNGYSIIADKFVEGQTSSKGDSGNQIKGNVYGGQGIIARNEAGLNIQADKVISRETLGTVGGGALEVSGPVKAGTVNEKTPGEVWVKDIKTEKTSSSADSTVNRKLGTAIKILGNCYVADDLQLNKAGYDVEIDGNYWGYHSGYFAGDMYDGSAIAINAPYADLTVAKKTNQTLWVAGLNNIAVNESKAHGDSDPNRVKEGESVTYKWTQDAYLLPGGCVPKYAANPLTVTQYNELKDNSEYLDENGNIKLNYANYPYISKINIADYLDPKKPYIVKFVQDYRNTGSTGETIGAEYGSVYLYLNFLSDSLASKFFTLYASQAAQRTALTVYANMARYGTITLNTSVSAGSGSDTFSGNIVVYSRDEGHTKPLDNIYESMEQNQIVNVGGEVKEKDPFIDSAITNVENISRDEGSSDPTTITSTSNSDYGTLNIIESNVLSDPTGMRATSITNRENLSMSRYNGLISYLDETAEAIYPTFEIAETIKNQVEASGKNINVLYTKSEDGTYTEESPKNPGSVENSDMTIYDNRIEISGSKKGILIADRDVYVQGAGKKFTGTIVTTGNVYLIGGATVVSSDDLLLNEVVVPTNKEAAKHSSVTVENWRKN